jgi:hypothetical protein
MRFGAWFYFQESVVTTSSGINQFVNPDGTINLYHYSDSESPTLISDPSKLGAHSFTRRDTDVSGVLRNFFYLNPLEKEHFLRGSRSIREK